MSEIGDRIDDVHREVGVLPPAPGRAEEARTVLLRRVYDATVEEVWDACTDPARIARWFLPITGDLRLGGHYRLEGNAGGEILRCEPPGLFTVSWLFGESPGFSEVEVRLTARGGSHTVFELEHAAVVPHQMWDRFGPGAVGVGWDLALLGLGLHLLGRELHDPAAWQISPEGRHLMTLSSQAWGAAYRASGAPEPTVTHAVHETTAFYAPDPSP